MKGKTYTARENRIVDSVAERVVKHGLDVPKAMSLLLEIYKVGRRHSASSIRSKLDVARVRLLKSRRDDAHYRSAGLSEDREPGKLGDARDELLRAEFARFRNRARPGVRSATEDPGKFPPGTIDRQAEKERVDQFALPVRVGGLQFARFDLPGGRVVTVTLHDGWLYIRGDSTLTVRPLNEREVYLKPVGYRGIWIPETHPVREVAR